MTDLTLRPVTEADHAAWLALWNAYLTFYETALPDDVSAVTWQRFLDPAEPTHAALAWIEGEAVGLVQWIYHRSNWSIANACYLQDLYVAHTQRGLGIGRRLIAHVGDAVRAAGCAKVHWLTHETNATAIALYQRVAEQPGFIQFRQML
ncbi:GNAT family N-acetyltransferase [Pseudomonas monteilii]